MIAIVPGRRSSSAAVAGAPGLLLLPSSQSLTRRHQLRSQKAISPAASRSSGAAAAGWGKTMSSADRKSPRMRPRARAGSISIIGRKLSFSGLPALC